MPAQSRLTLCSPVDRSRSLPGSSAHGLLQARILGCHTLLQEIFPTQGSNLHLSLALVGRFFILVPPRKPLAGGTRG